MWVTGFGRGCVKTQKKSAHEKSGFLEPPLYDFLGIGNDHPARENFMSLRFYTAWGDSRHLLATHSRN
jgi:hypothetical protein